MRRRLLLVAAATLVALAIVGLAVRPTFVMGYREIDDYTIAVQVLGANPTWRGITEQTETASEVTLGVSEIGMLQLGAGFGDERIGYVVVTLHDPLAGRQGIDASTGLALLLTQLLEVPNCPVPDANGNLPPGAPSFCTP